MRHNDGGVLATKVLDLAEQQGLLDAKAVGELRRQIAESKFLVTPEVVAKVLVDHGHLTAFQARKLINQALGPDPEAAKRGHGPAVPDELGFAEEEMADYVPTPLGQTDQVQPEEDEIIELEAVQPPPAAPPPPKPVLPAKRPPPEAPAAKPQKPPAMKFPAQAPSPTKEPQKQDKRSASPPASHKPAAPQPPPPAPPAPVRPPPAPTIEMVPLEAVEPSRPKDRKDKDRKGRSGKESSPRPAGSSRGQRWSAPPDSEPSASGLTPLGGAEAGPTTATADLKPLDDLLAADPLAMADPLAASPLHGQSKRRVRRNVWDSPLLLIGGGILGVILVAFGLLVYSFTRGSAAEMLGKAEEEYRAGSYSNAIAIYERFLDRYPDDPNVSLARVKRGMAGLRQVADDGRNPKLALQTAQRVLPEIETEEKFAEARIELSSILPDIADGFATQAVQADSTARKQELVGLTGEAMDLVNNPSYLPSSLRKDRESRIAGILDKLRLAERSIQQDQDLIAAVEKINAAAEQGEAAEAYRVRNELLRTYPGLESNDQLQAAIRQVGEKERQLVAMSEEGAAAATDDPQPPGSRVILSVREGGTVSAASGKQVFVLVEGAVYGLDAASGRVLWRRYVGYQATIPPVAVPADGGSDALIVDPNRGELLRVGGATGKLVWRQALAQPAGSPTLSGQHILATTRAGRILEIDAASGEVLRAAQLPQGATVPVYADSSRPRLLQLGEHSTLFVLDRATLACNETVYLGHRKGAIFVPPVAVLGEVVLVVESPGDDHSLIRILTRHEKSGALSEVGRPFRLRGRIVTPLSVSGRRVAAMTDLGQIAVYEVDAANRQQPIRLVAGLEAGERTPVTPYYALQGTRLWTANKRALSFEVQSSLQQLSRKWIGHQDDTFVGPLQFFGDVAVHVRRRPGWPSVLVEAAGPEDGKGLWTTHLAAPIVAMAADDAGQGAVALTAAGRLFGLTDAVLQAGRSDQPAFSPPPGSSPAILLDAPLSRDGQKLVWTDAQAGGSAYVYTIASGRAPAAAPLPAEAAAPAQLLGSRLVVPLADGSVALLQPGASGLAAAPFLPPVSPESLPKWTRPAILADDSGLIISDGRSAVYHVVLKDQPQPHLAAAGETAMPDPVITPLVAAGGLAFGVMRTDAADSVVAFDSRGAAAIEPLPLAGRLQHGPYAVGGLVFVSAEPDGLLCLAGDGTLRWQQPLEHGPLAGPPLAAPDGDLLVIHQSGVVRRVDPATGEQLAAADVGQPLGGAALALGGKLLLGGSDGVIHAIDLPPRP